MVVMRLVTQVLAPGAEVVACLPMHVVVMVGANGLSALRGAWSPVGDGPW